jgi:hypothetical protein
MLFFLRNPDDRICNPRPAFFPLLRTAGCNISAQIVRCRNSLDAHICWNSLTYLFLPSNLHGGSNEKGRLAYQAITGSKPDRRPRRRSEPIGDAIEFAQ